MRKRVAEGVFWLSIVVIIAYSSLAISLLLKGADKELQRSVYQQKMRGVR